jgi:hypothetical protein
MGCTVARLAGQPGEIDNHTARHRPMQLPAVVRGSDIYAELLHWQPVQQLCKFAYSIVTVSAAGLAHLAAGHMGQLAHLQVNISSRKV